MTSSGTREKFGIASTRDVTLQDQHTPLFDFYALNQEGTFTLAGTVTVNTRTFTASGGHGISVGDMIEFYEEDRFFQAQVLTVVTNDITIDTPFDFAFTTGADGRRGDKEMAVDGSSTPVTYRVTIAALRAKKAVDIVRFLVYIQDGSTMADELYGGGTALTNGLVCRVNNSQDFNVFNVKTNGEWAIRTFDASYTDKPPAGSFGFRVRRTFGGQAKAGVVVRITSDDDDEFQFIVQDDLTFLEVHNIVCQGSEVLD